MPVTYTLQERKMKDHTKYGKDISKGHWLNFKGSFSMENLYKLIYDWLAKYNYKDADGDGDKIEHYYYEKRGPDNFKGEVWFWWRTIKKNTGDAAFEYRINIDFQILAMKEATVTVDGQKMKVNNGEVSIFITPFLVAKSEQEWGKQGWNKKFYQWFTERVYFQNYDFHKDTLWEEFNDLSAIIKRYLKLQNYTSTSEAFHPQIGVRQHKL